MNRVERKFEQKYENEVELWEYDDALTLMAVALH